MIDKKATLLLLAVAGCVSGMAQKMETAVKTNLLYWTTATPNLAIEAKIGRKWTMDLSLGYNPFTFSDNKKLKHVAVQPELRYWTRDPFRGHFFAANLLYSHYNAGGVKMPFGIFPELKDHRFQGDLGAIGVGYGYSWLLGSRWSIEAEAAIGYGLTHYSKYDCATCGSKLGEKTKSFVMPTKLAVSLVYHINKVKGKETEQPANSSDAVVLPMFPERPVVVDTVPVEKEQKKAEPIIINKVEDWTKDDAHRVHFLVGKSDLRRDYRSNGKTLDALVARIQELQSDTSVTIRKIQVVGMASPEGSAKRNAQLIGERAEALKQYIQGSTSLSENVFECLDGMEEWEKLRGQQADRKAFLDQRNASCIRIYYDVLTRE